MAAEEEITQPKRTVVLDGGTGMSMVKMGHSFIDDDPLWSAAIVSSHPQDIIKQHKDFFLAGSEGHKKQFGVSENEAHDLVMKGVELAKTARDEAETLSDPQQSRIFLVMSRNGSVLVRLGLEDVVSSTL